MNIVGFLSNFGGMDGIILLIIVLLLFGAKRLPELARGLGSAINEFNKAKDDVHRQITQAGDLPASITPPSTQTAPPATLAQTATPATAPQPVNAPAAPEHPQQEQSPKA